jgi:hypothetical protein
MRKGKRNIDGQPRGRRKGAKSLLATEIELIIRERERLLRAAGAAATLFSRLDIRDFPNEARESVRRLGAVLDALPEETLTDAIELLIGGSGPRSAAPALR